MIDIILGAAYRTEHGHKFLSVDSVSTLTKFNPLDIKDSRSCGLSMFNAFLTSSEEDDGS